jgi:niacin transporter
MSAMTARPALNPEVLPFRGVKAIAAEALFIAAALFLPALFHWLSLPALVFLPMFWTVMLAGLVYGWKAGLLAGLVSPVFATLISGMPPAFILPAMTAEVALYGFVVGILRERAKLNAVVSIFGAILIGRGALVALLLATTSIPFDTIIGARIVPGLVGQGLQIVLLPVLATALSRALKDTPSGDDA